MREMLGWCLEQPLIVLAEMGRAPIAGASCLPPCFDPRERRSGALRAVKANSYDLRPGMLGHPFQHLQRLRREADTLRSMQEIRSEETPNVRSARSSPSIKPSTISG